MKTVCVIIATYVEDHLKANDSSLAVPAQDMGLLLDT